MPKILVDLDSKENKIVSIEEILSKPSLAKVSIEEIETLSEETQQREGKVID